MQNKFIQHFSSNYIDADGRITPNNNDRNLEIIIYVHSYTKDVVSFGQDHLTWNLDQ